MLTFYESVTIAIPPQTFYRGLITNNLWKGKYLIHLPVVKTFHFEKVKTQPEHFCLDFSLRKGTALKGG